ncbi:MAG TPA: YfiR family protein [Polyangiaceae bacterium]
MRSDSSRDGRRRLLFALGLSVFDLTLARLARAQADGVPIGVQAGLLAKVAAFDRNFASRAGSRAVVLVAARPDDTESKRAALEMTAALSALPNIGGVPHQVEVVHYAGAPALAEAVRTKRAAIVYFGPGFEKQIGAIRDVLTSVSVLTVGALPGYVPDGLVLGFDLVSSRPKLVINLTQAKKQHVAFPASVLNLMRVHS